MDTQQGTDDSARKRTQTACEACRATKIKCQPSIQPGVCQKCLDTKKECVSRTGPRTRRPRRPKAVLESNHYEALPPLPKPSATFTIDFEVAGREEPDDNFETLRESHADLIEGLFPAALEQDDVSWDANTRSASMNSPHTSSYSQPQSMEELHAKPSFNIASAELLLESFHTMLPHFPCISLPKDVTVQQLTSTRPFVLLAILAAASGSRTLQGHNLYDEEFRKVLGLKYVASGESTIELLQGILIYCAWYPFHLRPKNKQVFQYLTMASDIIQTLEINKDKRELWSQQEITEHKLEHVRAYMGYCYITISSILLWRSHRGSQVTFDSWTAYCCDLLESNESEPNDAIMATLVRLANAGLEAATLIKEKVTEDDQLNKLLRLGLESQLTDQLARIPSHIATHIPIRLQSAFVGFCLDAGTLLRIPRSVETTASLLSTAPAMSLQKIHSAVYSLKIFLQLLLTLEESTFIRFVIMDWGKLVVAIVLALRLSFPISTCPEFDSSWSRNELQFDVFLDKFSMEPGLTATSKKVDIYSATRVIVGVVKEKYYRQLKLHMDRLAKGGNPGKAVFSCPMAGQNMEQFFSTMDFDTTQPLQLPQELYVDTQPELQDFWAVMDSWNETGSKGDQLGQM